MVVRTIRSWRARLKAYPNDKKDVLSSLILGLFAGGGWLFLPPSTTQAASYEPAKHLLHTSFYPMRAYGGALIIISLMQLYSVVFKDENSHALARNLMATFWSFFAIVFALSLVNLTASFLGAGWAIFWTIRMVRLPVHTPFREMD